MYGMEPGHAFGGFLSIVFMVSVFVLFILSILMPWFIYRIKTNSDEMVQLLRKIEISNRANKVSAKQASPEF